MATDNPQTEWQTLNADDGHTFDAYVARPAGKPTGVVLVIQEIFGVNSHIQSVCERFAESGYLAVAPALFDRQERNYQVGYEEKDMARSRELMQNLNFDNACHDMAAVITEFGKHGAVSAVGFCLGGSLAYLLATRDERLAGSVCYYGRLIPDFAEESPKCPTLLHFGETDHTIPLDSVDEVREMQPELPIYLYPAGHGFNCDQRGAYHEESAKLAWKRTLAFLEKVSNGG